ncbi:hypothetical protein SLA2020_236740 [Shorea laevis]
MIVEDKRRVCSKEIDGGINVPSLQRSPGLANDNLKWYDEEDRDGDDENESSIKFSDLAKSMIRASRASQLTGAESMVVVCLVHRKTRESM